MLDFRLETLLAVCEYMNYTKAAAKLNVTQPGVSQHIKYLEDLYGIKIFNHVGKRIELTRQGEILLQAAKALKHDSMHLQEKLKDSTRKTITFGATLTVSEYMVRDSINNLIENNYASLKMHVSNTEKLVNQLNKGLIDFAIVEGYFEKKEFASLLFTQEEYICVASKDYPYDQVSIEDLFKETLIVREHGSGTREILDRFLQEKNYSFDDFHHQIELGNIRLIKGLVKQGRGITFIYKVAVKDDLEAGAIKEVKVTDFNLKHDISFIYQKDSIFHEDYKKIYNILKNGNV